jgi:hypothetical protein
MSNGVDEKIVSEFLEYHKDVKISNPDHYPKQMDFLIRMFLHHKKASK